MTLYPGQPIDVQIPPAMASLWTPSRYKVFYGGRGGGKSHTIARYLIIQSLARPLRILCAREYQASMAESVHRLLVDLIDSLGLMDFFKITNTSIISSAGAEFLFKGLAQNIESIKSTEGIDIVWIEEAERVSARSWDILIPTIRKPNSEIIISFNPAAEDDPTYQRFILNPPPNAIVQKVNYWDNPWFPDVLREEMEHCRDADPEKYLHVWEGQTRTISDAQIFKGKFVTEQFESPSVESQAVLFRYGADFGFGKDPNALMRCFVKDRKLMIDYEAYAYNVELNHLAALWRSVPGSQRGVIWCDAARPETIAFMNNASEANDYNPFDARPAPKWSGSIEDGIEFMRQFDKIVIHPRCTNAQYEFRSYGYKIEKQTQEVIPVVVDKYNHAIDAVRYALSPIITRRCSVLDAIV